jgi:hypothetical protein
MRPGPLVLPFALVALGVLPHAAHAGPALDDDQKPAATTPPASGATPEGSPDEAAEPEVPIEYGVGFRVREVFLPKPILDLFLARVPAGSSNTGIGGELTRRKGNTELQLGFEYEHVTPAEGVWINKGDNVAAGDQPDYIVSPAEAGGKNFGWFTVEFTFFSHAKITDWLYFRYGAGLGLGILTGQVEHYNVQCAPGATNDNVDPYCKPMAYQGTAMYTDPQPGVAVQVPYNLPPVFPVLNAIVGLQARPTPKITINLEGGIRTLPFIGLDANYFF